MVTHTEESLKCFGIGASIDQFILLII